MAGVPCRIVRNFGILKTVLSFPMRSEQYSAGPLDVYLTIKARRIMGKEEGAGMIIIGSCPPFSVPVFCS
jgi:hypothetical protein